VAAEKWAEDNDLLLIHDPKLPYSFNSGRWKRGYNPNIIFMNKNFRQQAIKYVNKSSLITSPNILTRIRPL
jgi:hypothetical protein